MFKVFSEENIKEVKNKKPLVLYYSENGACGPSGLFFVIFEDKSAYCYSTFYKKSDRVLVDKILEYVPQLQGLLGRNEEHPCDPKCMKGYRLLYLGLGNHALMHRSVYKENLEFDIRGFKTYCEQMCGERITDMFNEVEKLLK